MRLSKLVPPAFPVTSLDVGTIPLLPTPLRNSHTESKPIVLIECKDSEICCWKAFKLGFCSEEKGGKDEEPLRHSACEEVNLTGRLFYCLYRWT